MSKVDTLLKLIAYQKQYPHANEKEIAEGIGVSDRHLRRCRKEVNLLKQQLFESTLDLEADQVHFLMSRLNRHDAYHQRIIQQLQAQLDISYAGCLRLVSKGENAPLGWLDVGELFPSETNTADGLPPALSFWLQNLCYDPLLMCDRNGQISGRLATACEPVNGFSQWQITLRKELRWSDGKPIQTQEIISAFSESSLAPIVSSIKTESNTQLRVILSREEPLLHLYLRGVFVRPSHSPHPYRVISGAYRLKRFRPQAKTFRFEVNPAYYREKDTSIDWLTLTRFTRPANAIRAIEDQKLDLLPLRALRPFYQTSSEISPQQCPFFEDNYHLLFLNRHSGLLKDDENCRKLLEAIDYRTIALYLRTGQLHDSEQMPVLSPSTLDLRVACRGRESRHLAYLIGQSVRSSVINPISVKGELIQEVDAFVAHIFFGLGYSRLSRYFRSEGVNNFFAYTNPEVDELLFQLDQMADIAKRQAIGQQVLSCLQDDFAIIFLHPYFEYFLSPLEIQFTDRLANTADLVQNISELVVERYPHRR